MPWGSQDDGASALEFDPMGDLMITFGESDDPDTMSGSDCTESSGLVTPTTGSFDMLGHDDLVFRFGDSSLENEGARRSSTKSWTCRASSQKLKGVPKLLAPEIATTKPGSVRFIKMPYRHREPMTLILQMLHNSATDLPKCILPLALSQFAEYVDEFGLKDMIPTEVSQEWLSNIKLFGPPIPSKHHPKRPLSPTCSEHLSPWLNIYRVFGTVEELQGLIRDAASVCPENPQALGLNIPSSITRAINDRRTLVIEVVRGLTKKAVDYMSYNEPVSDGCTFKWCHSYHYAEVLRLSSSLESASHAGIRSKCRDSLDVSSPRELIIRLRKIVGDWNTDNTRLTYYLKLKPFNQHTHPYCRFTEQTTQELAELLSVPEHTLTVYHYIEKIWSSMLSDATFFIIKPQQ